jgi:predicted GH43/DUF377 family glycosyl hydrolase
MTAALLQLSGCTTGGIYRDNRPSPVHRMDAIDYGIVLRHGSGPEGCDRYGARDVWVFEADGKYIMHYDGAGPQGWLAVRAVSNDLLHWNVDGPVLSLGKTGEEDEKSASYGVTFFGDGLWHMFYLGTRHTSPAPDLVPALPYVTMKAQSRSPLGPWVKQPEVVPFRPAAGTFYSHAASPGQVVVHNGEYLQFFSGASIDNGIGRALGIARTRDLNGSWSPDSTPVVPLAEQIENASLYYEASNETWFLFTNHVGFFKDAEEFTDAIWVYWSRDLDRWDPAQKAVVLDGRNCKWSKRVVGLPSVVRFGNSLALFYDGVEGEGTGHVHRDIGLAWLKLPLVPPSTGR